MSTTTVLHPAKRLIAKIFYWAAVACALLFMGFMVTDFHGFIWELAFFGVLACAIIGNVISHPQVPAQQDVDHEIAVNG